MADTPSTEHWITALLRAHREQAGERPVHPEQLRILQRVWAAYAATIPRPADPSNLTRVTDVLARVIANAEEQLRYLPVLGTMLGTVGLAPQHAERLLRFLLGKVQQGQRLSPTPLLEAFSRAELGLERLPSAPPATWDDVFCDEALSRIQSDTQDSDRALYEIATDARAEGGLTLARLPTWCESRVARHPARAGDYRRFHQVAARNTRRVVTLFSSQN